LAKSFSPPLRSMSAAKARAASRYVGSLSNTKACKGVFVRERLATHTSLLGASKVTIDGGGQVRFQNVYRPRR
jgi:hypothetical protein